MNINISSISTIGFMAAVLICSLISNTSLATGSHAFWISKTHANLNKIENYSATMELSTSTNSTPVISQVKFKKPYDFQLIISSPDDLKGLEASFNNHSILMHNPINQSVLKIDGLKSPTKESKLEQVKSIYWYNQEHYEQVFTPSIYIADRLSVGLDFIAKDDQADILTTKTFIDYHHSIFMQADYSLKSGGSARVKNTAIDFNQSHIEFSAAPLADNSKITYWDFNRASLTDKQVEENISAQIHWPKDIENVWGLSHHQFYQQKNKQTAAGYFYNDAFFVIALTQPIKSKQVVNPQRPLMHGMPFTINETPAYFFPYPSFTAIEFERHGIRYILLANIHPQSLIDMASGIILAVD